MLLDLDAIFDPDRPPRGSSRPAATTAPRHPQPSITDLPPDWHFEWDERAAIMEFDGGLPRERAEALALADIVARMNGQPRPDVVREVR